VTAQKQSRIAHTVVLKLKTSDFKILTRSHTGSSRPNSCDELTAIALGLRDRVDAGAAALIAGLYQCWRDYGCVGYCEGRALATLFCGFLQN
jgi:hypothetical protein